MLIPLHRPSSIFLLLIPSLCAAIFIYFPLLSGTWYEIFGLRRRPWKPGLLPGTNLSSTPHPIELLVNNARADFDKVVARQSKTLEAATNEYKRRYAKNPPKGFNQWFAWAQQNNITRIDEYNQMMTTFAPLRAVSSQTLKQLLDQAVAFGGFTILTVKNHTLSGYDDVSDGPRETEHREHIASLKKFAEGEQTQHHKRAEEQKEEKFWFRNEFQALLSPILPLLPNFSILVNRNDEPVVALTKNLTRITKAQFIERSSSVDPSALDSYDVFVEMPSEDHDGDSNAQDPFWPYISNVSAAKEICAHRELARDYAMIRTPNRLIMTDAPVPILSMSKLSVNGDLNYPSPFYISRLLSSTKAKAKAKPEPWLSRLNDLYWTGSTRGGFFLHTDDWTRYQRQHLVGSVNSLYNTSLSARFAASPFSSSYNIRFSAITQADEQATREMRDFFGVKERDGEGEKDKHRFVFDVDGNSYTERFAGLMMGGATVMKMSLQREWWEEWCWGWVHWVPVSMTLEELPEMMEFLALTERGRIIAQNIAEEGSEWARKTFRIEEMTSYMFRLLLEYAELFEVDG